jgi:hypothetical protein
MPPPDILCAVSRPFSHVRLLLYGCLRTQSSQCLFVLQWSIAYTLCQLPVLHVGQAQSPDDTWAFVTTESSMCRNLIGCHQQSEQLKKSIEFPRQVLKKCGLVGQLWHTCLDCGCSLVVTCLWAVEGVVGGMHCVSRRSSTSALLARF